MNSRKNRTTQTSTNNWVAKHARKFNMAHTYEDRKKRARKGYRKHRGEYQ
jgi:hypothetical protein